MFDDPFLTQNLSAMFKIVSKLLFLLARQGCPGGCRGGRSLQPHVRVDHAEQNLHISHVTRPEGLGRRARHRPPTQHLSGALNFASPMVWYEQHRCSGRVL